MKKTHTEIQETKVKIEDGICCNKCGRKVPKNNKYHLLDKIEGIKIEYDLCENCIIEFYNSFKYKPEVKDLHEYDSWKQNKVDKYIRDKINTITYSQSIIDKINGKENKDNNVLDLTAFCNRILNKQFFEEITDYFNLKEMSIYLIFIPLNKKTDFFDWEGELIEEEKLNLQKIIFINHIPESDQPFAYVYGNNFKSGGTEELTIKVIF